MYRTLADPEFLCCLTHRSLRFNYIIRNFHCPLFNIILQKNPSACIFLQCMQRDFGVCLIKLSPETSHSVLPASLFYFLSPSNMCLRHNLPTHLTETFMLTTLTTIHSCSICLFVNRALRFMYHSPLFNI